MSRRSLNIEILPPETKRDAKEIVPMTRFTELKWFSKLSNKEQDIVKEEGQKLVGAMILHGISRLAIGAHLTALHEVLEPKRMWLKFLHEFTKYTGKQAWRYMEGYKAAREFLPERIIKAAEARGMDLIGIKDPKKLPLGMYTPAFKRLGPPSGSSDPNRYLDQLEEMRKELLARLRNKKQKDEPTGDPAEILLASYRMVSRGMKQLSSKQRTKYAEELFGMILSDLGIGNPLTVKPVAVPDDFRPKPAGRPATTKEEEPKAAKAS